MTCVTIRAGTMNVGMYQAAPMCSWASTVRPRTTAWSRSTAPTILKSHTSGSAIRQPPRRASRARMARMPVAKVAVGGGIGERRRQGLGHHAGHEKKQPDMAERVGEDQRHKRLVDRFCREPRRHVPLRDQHVDDQAQQELEAEDSRMFHRSVHFRDVGHAVAHGVCADPAGDMRGSTTARVIARPPAPRQSNAIG